MATKKRGLGRGLDQLLGLAAESAPAGKNTAATPAGNGDLQTLPVDTIQKGRYQPRHEIAEDALQELADSIRAQGVVQPVVVRPLAGQAGKYELIAGERRWRATQLAGLHEIPAVVRDVPDQAAMAMGLIENIQREELNPIEEAAALQRLIEEFGLTHQETADAVGRSRAAVSNLLRLLTLEPKVKAMLEAGQLEMGHARASGATAGSRYPALSGRFVRKTGCQGRDPAFCQRQREIGDSIQQLGRAGRHSGPHQVTLAGIFGKRAGNHRRK
jgi:ParB family chromosome partitioning protein